MLRCKKLYKNYIIGGFFNGEEHGYDEICAGAFQDQNGREHGTLRQRRA
jgi:hypothetical protein